LSKSPLFDDEGSLFHSSECKVSQILLRPPSVRILDDDVVVKMVLSREEEVMFGSFFNN
jgi:hypothetical protein